MNRLYPSLLTALLAASCTTNLGKFDDSSDNGDDTDDDRDDTPDQPEKPETTPPTTPPNSDDGSASGGQDGQDVGDADDAGAIEVGSGETTLYFVNDSSLTICWLYVEPCTATELSDDVLGLATLPPGWYLQLTGLEDQCYVFWAFSCDSDSYWYAQFMLDGDFTWTLTGGTSPVDTFDTAW